MFLGTFYVPSATGFQSIFKSFPYAVYLIPELPSENNRVVANPVAENFQPVEICLMPFFAVDVFIHIFEGPAVSFVILSFTKYRYGTDLFCRDVLKVSMQNLSLMLFDSHLHYSVNF